MKLKVTSFVVSMVSSEYAWLDVLKFQLSEFDVFYNFEILLATLHIRQEGPLVVSNLKALTPWRFVSLARIEPCPCPCLGPCPCPCSCPRVRFSGPCSYVHVHVHVQVHLHAAFHVHVKIDAHVRVLCPFPCPWCMVYGLSS
jgi:hypothetical protein